MKYLVFLLSLAFCIQANGQAQRVIHSLLKIDRSCRTLTLEIDSDNIEIRKTSGSRIMMETHVKIGHHNESILKFMSQSGRYDFVLTYDQQEARAYLKPASPNQPKIQLRGKAIREELSFVIYVPQHIQYVNNKEEELNIAKK